MKFNTLLLDRDRVALMHWEDVLRKADPAVFATKIPRANVQQAWMLAAIEALGFFEPRAKILCIGCHADTAFLAIRNNLQTGIGIDPVEGTGTLSQFYRNNDNLFGTFDVVFATSVIEHEIDDDRFIIEAWKFVAPGGVLLLTCDFKPVSRIGDRIEGANLRFYDPAMLDMLLDNLTDFEFLDKPHWYGEPDFDHAGHRYAFAAIGIRKLRRTITEWREKLAGIENPDFEDVD